MSEDFFSRSRRRRRSGRRSRLGVVAERSVRGAIAVVLGVFALEMLPDAPVLALAAGMLAIGIAAMAVTGRCPLSWALSRPVEAPALLSNYPDARHLVDLDLEAGRTGNL